LELLKKLEYLPEHHALAARELEEQIRSGKHAGWQPTPLPPFARHPLLFR